MDMCAFACMLACLLGLQENVQEDRGHNNYRFNYKKKEQEKTKWQCKAEWSFDQNSLICVFIFFKFFSQHKNFDIFV